MKNHLSKLIKPEVMEFKPYSPGLSIDEIKKKYKLDNVIKLASNENPLGTSPVVQEIIRKNAPLAFRYPAAGNPDLCRAIGQYLNIAPQGIVCGNGSDEIIDLLIRITAVPGRDNIVAFEPCFSIYKLQSRLCGIEFRQHALNSDFTFDWEGLLYLVDDNTRIVFITNPDNPSGHAVPFTELRSIAEKLPKSCLLVIDEAYIDFSSPIEKYSSQNLSLESENIVVLRTFSKMFALAGMRLGYGIMPHYLADYLKRVRLPFSVNILAEKAGMAALNDRIFKDTTLELIIDQRKFLSEELKKMDCDVYPSQANFIMFKPPSNAWDIFEQLLSKGIIIRPLKSYGLPELLRVSIGTAKENKALIKCLKTIMYEK